MNCGNCGQKNSPKAKLCSKCGANLEMAEYFHAPPRKKVPPAAKQTPPPVKQAARKPSVPPAPAKKKHRSVLLPFVLVLLLLLAVGIFAGSMHFYTSTERYLQTAEDFVQAVVLRDEEALAQCVHPQMFGTLRPLQYGAVDRCEAEAQSCEALAPNSITLPVEDTVLQLYRVHVGYHVYCGAEAYSCSMDVLLANIGGDVYAVKTENINNTALPAALPN